MNYTVVYFDGSNGMVMGGVIDEARLKAEFPEAYSRNNDDIWTLDQEGMMYAIPHGGPVYSSDDEEDDFPSPTGVADRMPD